MASDEERSLVHIVSRDRRLILSPPERSFSITEFLEMIALADSLKHFDERKGDRTVLDGVKRTAVHGDSYSIADAYEIARDLEIPADYVERAIALRCPTAEQQRSDIEKYGAVPSSGIIVETYARELTGSLQGYNSLDRVDTRSDVDGGWFIDFGKVRTKTGHKGIIMRKLAKIFERRISMAYFKFELGYDESASGKIGLDIELRDPSFLRACGDTLNQLHQHFAPQLFSYEVRYNYLVE